MKKMLSVVLAAVMLFALTVPALAANTVMMYCESLPEWSDCYVYWWDGESAAPEWPGLKMEQCSDGVWFYSVPSDAKKIIFNDGGSAQTLDLTIPTSGKNLYNVEKKTWKTYGDEDNNESVDYYLVGYIDGVDYGIGVDSANLGDHRFVNNQVTVTFAQDSYVIVKDSDGIEFCTMAFSQNTEDVFSKSGKEKMFVAGNQTVTFTLTVNADDTLTMSYQSDCDHTYDEEITKEPTCDLNGEKTFTCTKCAHNYTESIPAAGHQFVNGVCSVCGRNEPEIPSVSWYLVGYINGMDIGIGDDNTNLGQYAFVDGKVTVNVESDSYVVVKNNSHALYMTDALCEETSGTLRVGGMEKVKVPGGQSYLFALTENGDGTLTLSYQPACEHTYTEQVTTAPTCEKSGVKTFTCSECGHSYTENIPALGHKFINDGCPVCGITMPDLKPMDNDPNKVTLYAKVPESWTNIHAYTWEGETPYSGEWPGTAMEKDGNWYRIEIDAKAANIVINNGSDQQKTPDQTIDTKFDIYITVAEDGTATVEYGAENKQGETPVCEHTYTEQDTTAPTCEKSGVKTFTCSKCGHSYTENIPALGHKFTNDVCTVCGINKADAKPVDNDLNKVTLFAKVPEDWTPVNAYTWEGETPYSGEWPGTAMQKDGNWYRIEIDAKAANVIINNGGDQKKTQDLSIKTDRDIYITVNEDGSAVIEYGAENKLGTTTPPIGTPNPPPGENFPLSNFRVVGNAAWMGNWNPASDAGRMRQCGTNRYFLEVKDVPAGTYEFKITENGTWDRSWGKKDGNNETFTLTQKTNVRIYFELNGDDYKIEVDMSGTFGDVDLTGIVVLMGMAVLAVGILLLNRKKLMK